MMTMSRRHRANRPARHLQTRTARRGARSIWPKRRSRKRKGGNEREARLCPRMYAGINMLPVVELSSLWLHTACTCMCMYSRIRTLTDIATFGAAETAHGARFMRAHTGPCIISVCGRRMRARCDCGCDCRVAVRTGQSESLSSCWMLHCCSAFLRCDRAVNVIGARWASLYSVLSMDYAPRGVDPTKGP